MALIAVSQAVPPVRADDTNVTTESEVFIIEGAVYDSATGNPISNATVQAVGTGMACRANAEGRYRLILGPGAYDIRISHIGYYSGVITVDNRDTSVAHDVLLIPSEIKRDERCSCSAPDTSAQLIIGKAITRKDYIVSRMQDCAFDAYSRIVIADPAKPDSEKIMLITESRSTSYWKNPNRYKQEITARTQSTNIPAGTSLITPGEMLNFNRDRIKIGEHEIISPLADDALNHYDYCLLDTVYIDTSRVFVIEVIPEKIYAPLFTGRLYIADSTYDVIRIDFGFSPGVHIPMIDSARYYQSMARFNGQYWLPIEIGFGGRVKVDVPMPVVPRRIDFRNIASISNYRIGVGIPGDTFDEYDLVVADKADDIDTSLWTDLRLVPLTGLERRGYERIDSIKHLPKPFYTYALKGLAAVVLVVAIGNYDLFHYNRVEGPYTGLGTTQHYLVPNTRLRVKGGYSVDAGRWQYELGPSYRFLKKDKLWLGAAIKDEIVHRPTIVFGNPCNVTANAFIFKRDPFDYYRERGYRLDFSVEPFDFALVKVAYRDFRQSTMLKNTDYSILRRSDRARDNPPIIDGTMRSMTIALRYDTRPRTVYKDRDIIMNSNRYILVEAGIEYSSPDFIESDFDFRRYYLQLRAKMVLPGLGITELTGYAGSSDGDLPPQQFFIVDFLNPNFNTAYESNFAGDRAATIHVEHDFGPFMFRKTGIGFLEWIPFGLTVDCGAMWTEFHREPTYHDNSLSIAPTPYIEIGFGLDNLTPFLKPFNLAFEFRWQLSGYNTKTYTILPNLRL